MPLRLEIKKKLSARSDRVKSVELHPTEPWVLAALYSGNVYIWDYDSGALVKSFELCELPVRCAKFIIRKQWFVAASDDMQLRVFNYNTMEKVHAWEAHTDYIRFLEVHPSLPNILSSSDDMTIRLWDWEKNWDCIQVFEGHAHYVMMVRFNPKDTNTFASASLDRTIKVWGLGTESFHFSLDGHDRGVNAIDYYPGGDKPYLISGGDDRLVKIWDYQTRSCVQTLEGHTNNVCAVCFHTRLPLIMSGSEDGTVRIFHSTTYRAESTLNYGMERVWALAATSESNKLAIGFDEGTVVIKLGHELPVASLDPHTYRCVWARNNEVATASFKGIPQEDIVNGERMQVASKDMGSTEIFPQSIAHNCNGRFIVVCGDGEYIIYTSQTLRNKAFGSAMDFVWSSVGTGDYAVRESTSRVKTFRNFKEHNVVKPPIGSVEGLYGGALLCLRGQECVVFFDWDDTVMVRKIDVQVTNVYWNQTGELVCLTTEDSYYILKFNRDLVNAELAKGEVGEDGVDGSFDLLHEISDKVRTGYWVGDCFLYTTAGNRLNYYVGGKVMTLMHLDHPMYLLGYLPKEDRVYLVDKQTNFISFKVLQSVLEYQTAVVRKDFDAANALLPSIPVSEHSDVARFLESQGFKQEAMAVTRDPEHKFDLALELGLLEEAQTLLSEQPAEDAETTEGQSKWRRLGDLALQKGKLDLVEQCALTSGDVSGLLLLYTSTGSTAGMVDLAAQAKKLGRTNVAFLALFLLGRVEECLDLLVESNRIPEAAFMARTYLPSQVSRIVKLWKEELGKTSERNAQALADPEEYANLFPNFDTALQVEEVFKQQRGRVIPASSYPTAHKDIELNLIELFQNQGAPPAEVPGEEETATADTPVPAAEEAAAAGPAGTGGDGGGDLPAQQAALAQAQAAAEAQAAVEAAAAQAAMEQAAAAEKVAAERAAAEEAAADKAAAEEEAQRQRLADEKAAAEAAAAAQAEAQRLAEEKAAADKAAADKAAAEAQVLAAAAERRRAAEEEARRRAEEMRKKVEAEARAKAEEARARAMEEARKRVEEATAAAAAAAAASSAAAAPTPPPPPPPVEGSAPPPAPAADDDEFDEDW